MLKSRLKSLPISLKYIAVVLGLICLLLVLKSYVTSLFQTTKYFVFSINAASPLSNYITWMILLRLVYSNLHRNPVFPRPQWKSLVKHLAIAALIIAVHVLLSNLFFYSYFATTGMCPLSKIPTTPNAWNVIMVPFLKMVAGELPTEMIARFIEYALIAGALISIDINQENHRKSLELANVQKELNLTYLRALRMQLRPHFLFNTLNSVSSLMHDNVEEAQNVLARLGGLLRKTLQNTDELKLVLRDELNYIRDYLEIEQIRFNDRLMIEYDIDKAALSGLVPSLIMQPIVENAVKHGFKGALEDCTIRIEAKREGSNIRLSVIDNGRGTNNVSKVLKSPGVGIQNTLNRLETLYPERHSVAVHSNANEGLAFHITIPFETLNSDITYAH